MSKKEEFKSFVSSHPELVNYVKNKEHTWQDFYELYDMYGEDKEVWSKYKEDDSTRSPSLTELTAIVKNINLNSVQKYIGNAQKAINVIQELTTKTPTKTSEVVPKTPRPITKFFGD